jgi:Mn2+/Fe2+ NRAMP family transporter
VRFLAVVGPGTIVALADIEAGSITTAAASGAQFGMKLIPLQVLLIVRSTALPGTTVLRQTSSEPCRRRR